MMEKREGLPVQAVIFDLDGLMINSEDLAPEAWDLTLAGEGAALSREHYEKLVGASYEETIAYIVEQTGLEFEAGQLNRRFLSVLLERIKVKGKPMPGLLELLEALAERGYRLAVASNSPAYYVRQVLSILGLDCYFDGCVFSADQVARPKPAPDVYFRAAECLGVPPERCLVFEDSLTGVQAAMAAGMRCSMVPTVADHAAELADSITILTSLEECLPRLDDLLGENKCHA
jgi:HAD superfamily hydrolase (TIGR01509 family)